MTRSQEEYTVTFHPMGDVYARISVTPETVTTMLLSQAQTTCGSQFYIGHIGWTGLRNHNCTVRNHLEFGVLSFVRPDVISCIRDLAKCSALDSSRPLLDSRGHGRITKLKDPSSFAMSSSPSDLLRFLRSLDAYIDDQTGCLSTCMQLLLKFSSTTNS